MDQTGLEIYINQLYNDRMSDALNLESFNYSDFTISAFGGVTQRIKRGERISWKSCCSLFLRKRGTLLDVACGKGQLLILTKYYKPEKVAGINISEKTIGNM